MRVAHLAESAHQQLAHDELLRTSAGRRWRARLWVGLTVVGATAFILALYGAGGTFWHRLGAALHLFPSGFPDPDEPGRSSSFTTAQYLAPLVSLSLTIGIILGAYGRQMTVLRARRRRDHVVVCGLGEKGLRAARSRLGSGHKVTCIDLDVNGDAAIDLRARKALVLAGDATSGAVLRRARVDRADQIVCACHDDAVNAAIAATVDRIRGDRKGGRRHDREPPNVYVHVANPDLAHILRGRALGLERVRLHFFNADAVWARALIRAGPLGHIADFAPEPPVVVVAAGTPLGQAVFVRVARAWHYHCRETGAGGMQRLVLVDPDAERIVASLARRFPAIRRHSELVPIAGTAAASDVAAVIDPLRDVGGVRGALYPCLADDAESLAIAIQVRSILGPDGAAVFVPASAWTLGLAPLLLAGVEGVHPIGLTLEPNSVDLLNDSAHEAMAQEVHAAYLADRHESADFGTRTADRGWDELTDDEREANRHHVDGVVRQLQAVFLTIAPESDWDAPLAALTDTQIEAMAELEHARWEREKIADGWRYGAVRDNARKITPLLRPWSELDEDARDQDRKLVAGRPVILARAGLRIEPLPVRERLAELMHEQFRADRMARGARPGDAPTLAAWSDLDDQARELSYAAVDGLALQLAGVGLVAEPLGRKSASADAPDPFTPAIAEGLARAEHDRWCAWRTRQGWQYGPTRDDDALRHPDLVPWADLPEDRRQIDRDRVTALKPVLAAVRYRVVPIGG